MKSRSVVRRANAAHASPPHWWLLKTEPDVYSIDDLARDKQTAWEGVRNYQARNFLRDQMAAGELVLIHHSSCQPAGVAGLARVASASYPDPSQFDAKSPYFDPDSTTDDPRWWLVDVAFVEKFRALLPLDTLRAQPRLKGMPLLARGQRLSVQPVTPAQFEVVVELAQRGKVR